MKLTVTDESRFNTLKAAFQGRETFALTGAGLTTEYLATEFSYSPNHAGVGSPCVELELVQVSKAAAPAWNGEGLPPVGLAVEIKLKSTRADWCPATVLFCQDDALVIAWKAEGVARPTTLSAVDIRPIRTAEQVAAEEREKGVEEMLNHSPVGRSAFAKDFCETLYDAGARMPGEGLKA